MPVLRTAFGLQNILSRSQAVCYYLLSVSTQSLVLAGNNQNVGRLSKSFSIYYICLVLISFDFLLFSFPLSMLNLRKITFHPTCLLHTEYETAVVFVSRSPI